MNFKLHALASLIILVQLFILFLISPACAQDSTRQEVIIHLQPSHGPLPPVSTADSWYGDDKVRHLLSSFISTSLLTQTGYRGLEWRKQDAKFFAAGTTISLGFVKEIYDRRRPGNHFCWKDLTADLAGVLLGLVVAGFR